MNVTNLTTIVFLHQNIILKMARLLVETCRSIYYKQRCFVWDAVWFFLESIFVKNIQNIL